MNWNSKVVLVGPLPQPYQDRLKQEFPGLEIVDCSRNRDGVPEEIADARIVFGRIKPEEFARARTLEFIQTDAQGVEQYMYPALQQSDVRISNVGDLYSPAIAEHVLTLALALCRSLPDFVRWQQEGRWNRGPLPVRISLLHGKTIGFVGTGNIASHCATLFKCFECGLLGFSRSGRLREPFDEAVDLAELMKRSDIIVDSLPYTPESRHLLGPEAFQGARTGAIFINVGRGKTVDESALVAALQDGRLAGAGLDVFEQEPLPPESPLWRMPNVIITGHRSASGFDYHEGLYELFAENLRRLRDARPLLNPVDKERGY